MASVNDEARPGQNEGDIEEEEPPTKKLRSMEPDLKITLGEAPNQSEYWYQSGFMATHSGFIDTLLASPMRESISREINLPDVEPRTWDIGVKYLDPRESRKMSVSDAVKIVSLYDKYDFHQGRDVCDDVIAQGFKQALKYKRVNLGILVQAFVVCDSCNLSVHAMKAAFEYFQTILKDRTLRMMFSTDHLKKIFPVFLKAEKTFVPNVESIFHGFADDDITNPMFVRLVTKEWELASCYDGFAEKISLIRVYGLPERLSRVEGISRAQRRYNDGQDLMYYDKNPTTQGTTADEASSNTTIMVRVREPSHGFAGWCLADAIHGHGIHPSNIRPLWYVPNSMGRPLPPVRGWIPTDTENLKGTHPKIAYELP